MSTVGRLNPAFPVRANSQALDRFFVPRCLAVFSVLLGYSLMAVLGSLAFSLVIAFIVTTPVNRWMISRGLGHAVVHGHH